MKLLFLILLTCVYAQNTIINKPGLYTYKVPAGYYIGISGVSPGGYQHKFGQPVSTGVSFGMYTCLAENIQVDITMPDVSVTCDSGSTSNVFIRAYNAITDIYTVIIESGIKTDKYGITCGTGNMTTNIIKLEAINYTIYCPPNFGSNGVNMCDTDVTRTICTPPANYYLFLSGSYILNGVNYVIASTYGSAGYPAFPRLFGYDHVGPGYGWISVSMGQNQFPSEPNSRSKVYNEDASSTSYVTSGVESEGADSLDNINIRRQHTVMER